RDHQRRRRGPAEPAGRWNPARGPAERGSLVRPDGVPGPAAIYLRQFRAQHSVWAGIAKPRFVARKELPDGGGPEAAIPGRVFQFQQHARVRPTESQYQLTGRGSDHERGRPPSHTIRIEICDVAYADDPQE